MASSSGRGGFIVISSAVALLATGCGELVSWDDQWLLQGDGSHTPSGGEPAQPELGGPGGPAAPLGCEASPLGGYHYAAPPEFWLGSQAALTASVDGAGYLVAGPATASSEQWRYLQAGALSVAPDGTLELGAGEPALGYAPGSVGGPCLVELRAPVTSPPRASSRIDLVMNFDARSPVTTFDIYDPPGTSNGSTSITVFDSLGTAHVLDIYITHLGGQLVTYYVVTDGRDLAGGTPGTFTLIGLGTLQFTSDGALDSATTPELAPSFVGGATANQAISIHWGHDIPNDGTRGYDGSTMFAADTAVYSQAADGFPSGTGTAIDVDASGHVRVSFDSGDVLDIGALALARFPRESGLAPLGPRDWAWTPESGSPLFAAPLFPGRGELVVTEP